MGLFCSGLLRTGQLRGATCKQDLFHCDFPSLAQFVSKLTAIITKQFLFILIGLEACIR